MHLVRWRKYGDPERTETPEEIRARNQKVSQRRWLKPIPEETRLKLKKDRKADIGYTGAHARVRRKYGLPTEHCCVSCGDEAKHWAFMHEPADSSQVRLSSEGKPYSTNPDDYRPMCVSCHHQLDGTQADVV